MPDLSVKYPDFFLLEKDSAELIQSYIYQLVTDVLPRKLNLKGADIQLLTPMKKGNLGVEQLNSFMQEKCNPPSDDKMEYSYGSSLFREGDRVMQIRNDYELEWDIYAGNIAIEKGKGVFNGDTGVVDEINAYLKIMKVIFDDGRVVYYEFSRLDELELAYAVTVHKSQGSEYPVVILPLLSGPQMLFHRNILYTAVTRAKQCVIILGSAATVRRMVGTDNAARRYTSLAERIKEIETPA
jgi:exodeoxyribonuclease V alpha subunit